jgi:hypothetical protein
VVTGADGSEEEQPVVLVSSKGMPKSHSNMVRPALMLKTIIIFTWYLIK